MFLVCGLGNFGNEYNNTRHNVGFEMLELLATRYNTAFGAKQKFKAEIASANYLNKELLLVKPLTYVNLSGQAIQMLVNFYKLPTQNIIIIHDDLELPCGKIKAKIGGGNAGHNGLRSIDQAVGKNYLRIRIGIDRPAFGDVSSYVLGKVTPNEKKILKESYYKILAHIELLFEGQLEKFNQNINLAN